jgi:CheY-like chemotaxis protein
MLPRVFDMFTQITQGSDRAQGGLGIGLSLVKALVEMHGGRIEARSEGAGRGAEFIVRLPIAVDAAAADDADRPGEIARTALRILVVDDNQDGADSLARMLAILGNETRTAYDGEQAVAAAEAYRPDVVLLDIGLPKLSGHAVAREIRSRPWGAETVLIALTGWGQEEDRKRSQEAGFDSHLVKPVEPKMLTRLLAATRPRP